MKLKKIYIILIALILASGVSAYYAKKLRDQRSSEPVVVVSVPPQKAAVVIPEVEENPGGNKVCEEQVEFKSRRRELGLLVNDHVTRKYNRTEFTKKIENWRKNFGLPVPLRVDAAEAQREKIVFNNCRPSCRGQIHQVFVSRIVDNKSVEVLGQNGKLKLIPLNTSGVEVLILDELNRKGIPFRSWPVPVENGPWFLKGNNLYVGLDMEGVWLQITDKGDWTIVPQDKNTLKLNPVDPLTVPGCLQDEICLTDFQKRRFFKLPKKCV